MHKNIKWLLLVIACSIISYVSPAYVVKYLSPFASLEITDDIKVVEVKFPKHEIPKWLSMLGEPSGDGYVLMTIISNGFAEDGECLATFIFHRKEFMGNDLEVIPVAPEKSGAPTPGKNELPDLAFGKN